MPIDRRTLRERFEEVRPEVEPVAPNEELPTEVMREATMLSRDTDIVRFAGAEGALLELANEIGEFMHAHNIPTMWQPEPPRDETREELEQRVRDLEAVAGGLIAASGAHASGHRGPPDEATKRVVSRSQALLREAQKVKPGESRYTIGRGN